MVFPAPGLQVSARCGLPPTTPNTHVCSVLLEMTTRCGHVPCLRSGVQVSALQPALQLGECWLGRRACVCVHASSFLPVLDSCTYTQQAQDTHTGNSPLQADQHGVSVPAQRGSIGHCLQRVRMCAAPTCCWIQAPSETQRHQRCERPGGHPRALLPAAKGPQTRLSCWGVGWMPAAADCLLRKRGQPPPGPCREYLHRRERQMS